MITFYSTILYYHVSVTRTAVWFLTSSPYIVSLSASVLRGAIDKNTSPCNKHFVINPASECTKPFILNFLL